MSVQSYDDELARFLTFTAVGLVVLAIIVLAWITVKILETVVRAVTLYPHCRPLQVTLGAFVVLLVLTVLFGAALPILGGLWLISLIALPVVAKITLVYYDTLFQRELNRATLTERVLHEPWWNGQAVSSRAA